MRLKPWLLAAGITMSLLTSWANTHKVQQGDNDETIAKKHGMTVAQLHKLNPGVKWDKLKIGQAIQISSKSTAPVKTKTNVQKAQAKLVSTSKTATFVKTDVILRNGPSTSAEKITLIAKGRTAGVVETKNGWVKVQFSSGTTGWVRGDMVTVSGGAKAATPKTASAPVPTAKPKTTPAVKPKTDTTVAKVPDNVEPIQTAPPAPTKVEIVSTKDAQVAATEPVAVKSVPTRVKVSKNDVIVRSGPGTSNKKITTVTKGRVADVLASKDGWYKVKFSSGTIGWVRGDMVSPATSEDKDLQKVAKAVTPSSPVKVAGLLDTAKDQLGVRYVYGGTSRGGFDCSGFVQYVFSKHGIKLPRTALQMSSVGQRIDRDDLQPGDQVFFITVGRRVSHVGIYIGGGNFIHASSGGGRVRINKLSESYYNNRYAGARRQPGLKGKLIAADAVKEQGKPVVEGPVYEGPLDRAGG